MKRILDFDAHTGLTQIYHGNGDGSFAIQTVQDVTPFLGDNTAARNNASTGWKGEFHEVASIPPLVWHMWWKELGDDPGARRNKVWLAAKLNSSEFSGLRTKEGRI